MEVTCFKGWSEENGNKQGTCCCNCRYQRPIAGHPWNRPGLTKGSINSIIGYGWTVPDMPNIIFIDGIHGMCEMWTDKNNVIKLERVK